MIHYDLVPSRFQEEEKSVHMYINEIKEF
jgi:hypothetical protein